MHGLLEAGDPGQERGTDRISGRRRICGGAVGLGLGVVARVGCERLEDERIEGAEFGERTIQRRMATQDEDARAHLLGRRLGLAPAMAAGIEHERQPVVDGDELGLDHDAAEEAVEHDRVERLERLGNPGQQFVELGELGVAQVLLRRGDGTARRRRGRGQAHRPGPQARPQRPARRQAARRAARRCRTSGSSLGRW